MSKEQTANQLHRELHEYLNLTDEQQKRAYWERISQEANGRTDEEKALFRQAIADDVEQIKLRVLDLKKRVDDEMLVTKS